MMSGEAWLFLLAVLINAVNLFLQVFFTIMYSDLEWYARRNPSPSPSSARVPVQPTRAITGARTGSTVAAAQILLLSLC